MAMELLPDGLYLELAACLPKEVVHVGAGRPPVAHKVVLRVILLVLYTGMSWRKCPKEFGCSEKTCRRRIKAWTSLGVWQAVLERIRAKLRASDRLNWEAVLLDASHVKAPCGGENAAPARWTAADQAANSTSRPTRTAFRWQRRSRPATPTKSRRLSTC